MEAASRPFFIAGELRICPEITYSFLLVFVPIYCVVVNRRCYGIASFLRLVNERESSAEELQLISGQILRNSKQIT